MTDCRTGFMPPAFKVDEEKITKLEEEIESLTGLRAECETRARELLEREVGGEGSHAPEIFRLKQQKQMLTAQIHILRVKINQLRLGITA